MNTTATAAITHTVAASTGAPRREARDAAIANMPTTQMEEVAGEWRGLGNLRDAVPTERWVFATV